MNQLIGVRFHSIYRFMDMLCLNFGKDIMVVNLDTAHEPAKRFPEFSLHLQTQWRFLKDGKILLGSRDIYHPFSDDVGEDWDYNPHGRDDCESSVFDVEKRNLQLLLTDTHVVDASVSSAGDIRIEFSNSIIFEVFIPASYQDEEWRLIDCAKDEHLIFYDIG